MGPVACGAKLQNGTPCCLSLRCTLHLLKGALHMAPSNGHVTLLEELVLGRRASFARFRSSPTRTLSRASC
jgi:hypothetical protein